MRKIITLLPALMLISSLTIAQERKPIKIIEPKEPGIEAKTAEIDTEHFELGVNLGLLSVEDFNTNPIVGLSFNYYFNEKIFAYFGYGTSDTKRANSEGALDFNPDRTFDFFSSGVGYRVLDGRSFWGKKRKYNSGVYFIVGLEQVDFAQDSDLGYVLGLSHRTILTDWISLNIDIKDHIVNRTFVDDEKLTQNIEFTVGLSTFF